MFSGNDYLANKRPTNQGFNIFIELANLPEVTPKTARTFAIDFANQSQGRKHKDKFAVLCQCMFKSEFTYKDFL